MKRKNKLKAEIADLRERFDYLVGIVDLHCGGDDGYLAHRIRCWCDPKRERAGLKPLPTDD